MAEALGLGASVIAIIQIANRVIGLCKFYIETAHNAPSDIRTILIETSTIKAILESLQFLISCNSRLSSTLNHLSGVDGPIDGCRRTIIEIEALFPSDHLQEPSGSVSKTRRLESILTALVWPLKENKARKLLGEITRYKTIINLALTTESTWVPIKPPYRLGGFGRWLQIEEYLLERQLIMSVANRTLVPVKLCSIIF